MTVADHPPDDPPPWDDIPPWTDAELDRLMSDDGDLDHHDIITPVSPDREWYGRAIAGLIDTPDAHDTAAQARSRHERGQLSADQAEMLAAGDTRMPEADYPARYAPTELSPPVDVDPDTMAALDRNNPPSMVDRIRSRLHTTADLRAMPPPEYLIDGWLVRNSLAMLFGPSGTYKTFLGIDLALHVATGSWWHGKHAVTRPGRVLYVIAEGAAGAPARIAAWEKRRNTSADNGAGVTWLPRAINLADRMEAAAFAEVAQDVAPDLVVIDTLARCTLGAEENSARDMGAVVEALDSVRRATGACVLTVHHTGKDSTSGARGSSALRGAMDTELEMVADPLYVTVTKQKDGPEADRLYLHPMPQVDSIVLEPTANIAQGDHMGAADGPVLEALLDVHVPGGVPSGTWQEAASVAPRTFHRAKGRLVSKGLVRQLGSEGRPRYSPATAIVGDPEVTDA